MTGQVAGHLLKKNKKVKKIYYETHSPSGPWHGFCSLDAASPPAMATDGCHHLADCKGQTSWLVGSLAAVHMGLVVPPVVEYMDHLPWGLAVLVVYGMGQEACVVN